VHRSSESSAVMMTSPSVTGGRKSAACRYSTGP
jgi:hypothetical protein